MFKFINNNNNNSNNNRNNNLNKNNKKIKYKYYFKKKLDRTKLLNISDVSNLKKLFKFRPKHILINNKIYHLYRSVIDKKYTFYAPNFVNKLKRLKRLNYEKNFFIKGTSKLFLKNITKINKSLVIKNLVNNFDKNNLNNFRQNKSLQYALKKKENKLKRKVKFYLFLIKKKNNFFATINTNYNKLLFKMTSGQLTDSGPKKLKIETIALLASKIMRFLFQNKIRYVSICLKSRTTRLIKAIVRVFRKEQRIRSRIFRVIKLPHSKPMTSKKKKRL